ncbi:MAG: hypothetical protein AVDCRST_MAG69-2172, partial [uncultured Solirubrobacteraceae bacterium]
AQLNPQPPHELRDHSGSVRHRSPCDPVAWTQRDGRQRPPSGSRRAQLAPVGVGADPRRPPPAPPL